MLIRCLVTDDSPEKVPFGGRLKEFEAFFSSGSNKDLKEIEITRLRETVNGLRRVIRSLRRGNARLRKTVTILRSDYHTPSTEEDHNNKQAIPVPPRGPRLRGDIWRSFLPSSTFASDGSLSSESTVVLHILSWVVQRTSGSPINELYFCRRLLYNLELFWDFWMQSVL